MINGKIGHIMNLFSKNLRFLRKKSNYNQDDISILFNKRANTIGNWENEKSEPSLAELIKLCGFFEVSTTDMLNKDLEKDVKDNHPIPSQEDLGLTYNKANKLQEPQSRMANEESLTDAFWLILRELRTVHGKVDILVASMGTMGIKKNSDKSDH